MSEMTRKDMRNLVKKLSYDFLQGRKLEWEEYIYHRLEGIGITGPDAALIVSFLPLMILEFEMDIKKGKMTYA